MVPRLPPAVLVAACLAAPVVPGAGQVPRVVERVDVARVVIDAHVLQEDGRPVAGLGPDDLRVFVDGRPARIESVRWTTAAAGAGDVADVATPAPDAARPRGRLAVLLFQKDLEPSRIVGLMAMLRRASEFLDGLAPEDRVAILSFHHHLELWTDFTLDRARLRTVVERSVLFAGRAGTDPAPSRSPALLPAFDREAGRRASTMEQALAVLARALDAVPGPKALVVFGHGFGRIANPARFDLTTVDFEPAYEEARRLFARARTSVYCLDVTHAASHTLEAGLVKVAEDTGGFYARTHEFPGAAMKRLAAALDGHYEVTIEKPDLPPGEHAISVRLVGRRGVVFARRSYVG